MEAFAYRIMQTGYSNSLFFSWGMLLAFAAVVVFLVKPKFRMGRAAYFSVMGLCILFFGMRYFIDGFFQDAVKNDYLFKLVLGSYSCLTIGAVLLGLASAARSNDAYGHWKNWFLGFIPLVSLVLLFKSPLEPGKPGFSRVAVNILLIVLGLCLVGSGRMLVVLTDLDSRQTAGNAQNDPEFQKKAERYELQNRGVNGWLQEVVKTIHTPEKIDWATVMSSAKVDGDTLRFVYEVAYGSSAYSQIWKNQKTYELCKMPAFANLMEAGGTIEKKYLGEQGMLLGEARANTQLCGPFLAGIAKDAQEIISGWHESVPINDETTWTNIEYRDDLLIVYFEKKGNGERVDTDSVLYKLCGNDLSRKIMDFGVDARVVTGTSEKVEIGTDTVPNVDCTYWIAE